MLGEPLLRLDECDSTNRVALDWDDAPHGACVVARSQSGGRGRLGRQWESAAGKGLYLSVVLRVERELSPLYSLASAVAVRRGLGNLLSDGSDREIKLKWPNDVLWMAPDGEARKIGGILGEGRGDRLVIGIGVNVNQRREDLPVRPLFPASSLSIETGREWNTEAVLQAVLVQLSAMFHRVEGHAWAVVPMEFEMSCLGRGEVVRVQTETGNFIGVFDSVGTDGALILRTADGWQRIVAGDVSYF